MSDEHEGNAHRAQKQQQTNDESVRDSDPRDAISHEIQITRQLPDCEEIDSYETATKRGKTGEEGKMTMLSPEQRIAVESLLSLESTLQREIVELKAANLNDTQSAEKSTFSSSKVSKARALLADNEGGSEESRPVKKQLSRAGSDRTKLKSSTSEQLMHNPGDLAQPSSGESAFPAAQQSRKHENSKASRSETLHAKMPASSAGEQPQMPYALAYSSSIYGLKVTQSDAAAASTESQADPAPNLPAPIAPGTNVDLDSTEKDESRARNAESSFFPKKLYTLLMEMEAESRDSIVSFTPSGYAFRIHDEKAFIEEIVPRYFRHKKIESFKRQLNLYGFDRVPIGPEEGAYAHPLFRRGHPSMVKEIKRVGKAGAWEPPKEGLKFEPSSGK